MKKYVARKLLYALLTLYFVASMNFLIFQVFSPIDPVKTIINPNFRADTKDLLRKLYGLDQPIIDRYFKYVFNMFTFSFGYSFVTWNPVVDEIMMRLPNTLLLLGAAFVATVIVGIPLGIFAASRRGSKSDVMAMGLGLFTWSVPEFFIQLLFLFVFSYLFAVWFGFPLFPYGGITNIPPPSDPLAYALDMLYHLVLPVLTLVLVQLGSWTMYTRNMMLDTLTQDFIVTARAKGFSERKILYKHAFRVVLSPIITMIVMSIPPIFTGAIITEFVFTWPGIGGWLLMSIKRGDYPAVQGVFFIFALLVISLNLLSDLLYGLVDPRIRRR